MNILRSWLFKLSAVGGVSFGGLEYMIHKRDRPEFLQQFMKKQNIAPSRKYMIYSLTRGKNTYFDDSIVKLIKGFNYFEVFESQDNTNIYCIFNASRKLQFYTKHIHEGLLAALVDNLSGFQAIVVNKSVVATSSLKLTYDSPVLTDTYYLIQMKEQRVDDRRSKILGQLKKIDNGIKDNNNSVKSETMMVSIDWRGLSQHDKSKKAKSQ